MSSKDLSALYDADYYEHHCGDRAYTPDDPAWKAFFGSVADRIVGDIAPTSVLDVGCAFGFLVAELRERGINAKGFDFSTYAIEQAATVAPGLEHSVWVGSATDPIEEHYDLIVTVEMIEHLPDADGRKALANMTAACDRLLLSSTPLDFVEPTHVNVRPVEYWAEILAQHGFYRDLSVDTDFLTPWAGLYTRREASQRELVREYERSLALLSIERGQLRREHQRLVLESEAGTAAKQSRAEADQAALQEAERSASLMESLADEHEASRRKLLAAEDKIVDLKEQLLLARDAYIGMQAEAAEAKSQTHLHATELQHLKAYYEEIEHRIVGMKAEAEQNAVNRRSIEQMKSSTSWRLIWLVLTPYRRLKVKLLGHG